jgi:nucleoid DNA-binding protein
MVTKEILAKKLREPGLSYRDASVYFGVLFDAIKEILSKGESLQLRGFGTFQIVVFPEKKHTLKTGTKIVPAHGHIKFKPCKELKQKVWACTKEKNSSAMQNS